jgi:hypothetical protein
MAHDGDIKRGLVADEFAGEQTCRNCLAPINLIRTMVDSITGRTARVFECDECGQRTWDDLI